MSWQILFISQISGIVFWYFNTLSCVFWYFNTLSCKFLVFFFDTLTLFHAFSCMNKSSIFWCLFHKRSLLLSSTIPFKGGPEPSNFEDLCLVNVSVKYFSKLCFGTIKIQPELKYLKPFLEDFTFWFQRAKAWFGRVPSISFIFTGRKMARICKVRYYQYLTSILTD